MSIDSVIGSLNSAGSNSIAKRWTLAEVDGYKRVSPALVTLASDAGVSPDEMALAALVCSEVGSLPAQYQYAVAEVALNEAAARGTSVSGLLCGAPAPGCCGEQRGRWASTARPPTARHLLAARLALQGAAAGFTRNARKFFDPKVQDGGSQGGRALAFDAMGIVRKWYGEGYRWVGPIAVPLIGTLIIDPYRLFLMSKTGAASQTEAEEAIVDGRRRWKVPLSVDTSNASREMPDDDVTSEATGLLLPAALLGGALLIGKVTGVL